MTYLTMIKRTSLFYALLFCISCNNAPSEKSVDSVPVENKVASELRQPDSNAAKAITPTDSASAIVTIKTFANQDNSGTFGYDVMMNGKIYIHQPFIPAIPGNHGFETESDAKKTGELMADKIRHNVMPPSLSVAELKAIGIQ
jgi:hypothetical protein